ncbi:MAG: L-fucose-proton symporter [Pseudomonadota bacterium]
MALAPSGNVRGSDGAKIDGNARSVLFLTFAVFFILGGVTNINDVLIPKLKNLFQLSHFEANLVQFAFFMSYALFSIPAGILVARIGYVRGFVAGFLIVALGALLFLPAANSGIYVSFLAALFVIGGGITLLQVGMNPVTIALGPKETSHSRLTFAQLFNSIGVFLMVYGGAELMLGKESGVDLATLSGASLQAQRVAESAIIGQAYMWLAAAMAAIAGLFWFWRSALDKAETAEVKVGGTLALFLNNARVRFGAVCIFTYVGAEVDIGSNLFAYLTDDGVMGITAVEAGRMLALYWGGAMIGRFFGGFILRMFKPGLVLATFAGIAITLILFSGLSSGAIAGWSIVFVGFFNSLMFPTIFSLGTEGLTDDAPRASGIMCTAIVGGALVPPLFGLVADGAGLKLALAVPIICYAIIASFGLWAEKRA